MAARCRVQVRHGDHIGAVGRKIGAGQPTGVARRDHHNRPRGGRAVNGRLDVTRAGTRSIRSQAHVEHSGRGWVGRGPGNGQTRRPKDARTDVETTPSAITQHTHRDKARIPGDACHPGAIISNRVDNPGHMRAMPGAVGIRVARIVRIRIPTAAILRHGQVADKVIAQVQPARVQFGMVGDPGI